MKTKKYMVDPKEALANCVCRYRPGELTYYVIEKSKFEYAMKHLDAPIPRGFPVPSARVKEWHKYVAEYDPFDWTESRRPPSEYYAIKERERKRLRRAEIKARKQGAAS